MGRLKLKWELDGDTMLRAESGGYSLRAVQDQPGSGPWSVVVTPYSSVQVTERRGPFDSHGDACAAAERVVAELKARPFLRRFALGEREKDVRKHLKPLCWLVRDENWSWRLSESGRTEAERLGYL